MPNPATQTPEAATEVVAYKAFDADFSCRGHKFEVGQTYSVGGKIVKCKTGFHACPQPFDVWVHYPVVGADAEFTRYAEVIQSGDTDGDGDKVASATITIKAELAFPDFIKRAVSTLVEIANPSDNAAQIGSSGYGAQIGSSGNAARIGSCGNAARIGSSGDNARINASGDNATIACAAGASVKAGPGGAICIAYHDGTRTRFATGYVGEDGIEAGKWYAPDPGTGKLREV